MGNANTRQRALQLKLDTCINSKGEIDVVKVLEVKQKWELAECDIAVLGQTGVGKSSLINSLLGVPLKSIAESLEIQKQIKSCPHTNRAECKHTYAPTSSAECTDSPIPYSFADNTTVYLWDLPGYGGDISPTAEQFWKKFDVDNYDAVLYVSHDNRIHPQDREIVKLLTTKNKVTLWVRTKFDNTMRGRGEEDEKLERDAIQTYYLERLGISSRRVYCVSSNYDNTNPATNLYKYDHDALKAAIMKSMPDEIEQKLAVKFQGYSVDLIQAKFFCLQKAAALIALFAFATAAGTALLPVAGPIASGVVDTVSLMAYYDHASRVYGFSSTEELMSRLKLDPEMVKKVDKKLGYQVSQLRSDIPVLLATGIATTTLVESAISLVPIVGSVVAGALSGSVMTWALITINAAFRDCAVAVLTFIDENIASKCGNKFD